MLPNLGQSARDILAIFGEQQVLAFFLVLARISPLFLIAPLFSSRMVPARVRGIVAVALTIGIAPVVAGGPLLPTGVFDIVILVVKELLVGGLYAFVLAALFAALSVAGSFLDFMIGFSFGASVDPVNGQQGSLLTTLYGLLGVVIFIAIGGDAWVIGGLVRSYELIGIAEMPSLGRSITGAVGAFTTIFTSAIQIAGPVMLALILTDAAFGVISKVMPQLSVFQVGFPAKVLTGLVLVGATLPFVAGWLADRLEQDVGVALRALRIG